MSTTITSCPITTTTQFCGAPIQILTASSAHCQFPISATTTHLEIYFHNLITTAKASFIISMSRPTP